MALTEKAVEKLKPSDKRQHVYDGKEPGFGLRIEPAAKAGRKSYFWFKKVNNLPRFRSCGEFPSTPVDTARDEAARWNGVAAAWKQSGYEEPDPFEKKKRVEPVAVVVPTFRAMVDAYIANHIWSEDEDERANHPERAEKNIRWMLKRFFNDWLDRKVDEIGVADVLTVKNACGAKHHSANRAVEFVRAIYGWSSKTNDDKINFWLTENPAVNVGYFKEKKRERFLQPDEYVRFDEALKSETHVDLKDFLTLAIDTGARKGDIFSMRWQDIHWERKIWTVPFPKNGESYNVQILDAPFDVLKRRRSQSADSDVWVFPSFGKSGHLLDLKEPWISFRKRARLSDVRMHDLRRTNGSYSAIAGVPLQQIGAQLGHKSLQSTQVYAHLLDETVRAGREKGQAKRLELMNDAKERAKLAAPVPMKALKAASRG